LYVSQLKCEALRRLYPAFKDFVTVSANISRATGALTKEISLVIIDGRNLTK
jgi:hypothetical protein